MDYSKVAFVVNQGIGAPQALPVRQFFMTAPAYSPSG
jgi:hypothetical protein